MRKTQWEIPFYTNRKQKFCGASLYVRNTSDLRIRMVIAFKVTYTSILKYFLKYAGRKDSVCGFQKTCLHIDARRIVSVLQMSVAFPDCFCSSP